MSSRRRGQVTVRLALTDGQKSAATSSENRIYIEASPGSGKTTVAAERYGVARFGDFSGGRGVVALSFARSARGELEDRVQRRWGVDAMRWPHKVWTLDSLHCAILRHFLRSGTIEWPGGHTDLTVVDSWRGSPKSRPLDVGTPYYGLSLTGKKVVAASRQVLISGTYYTNKSDYFARLSEGVCTHDEIRHVLEVAVAQGSPLREIVRQFFKDTAKALIVDEVFDGNLVDLRIVASAAAIGVPTTLIGDPWQALYAFRGARPELVPQLTTKLGFAEYPIAESFRFRTEEMKALAVSLRAGSPVTVAGASVLDVNVVLSSDWAGLWTASNSILPFSFGQVANRVDAAIALLLDQVVTSRFRGLSTFGPDAGVILGLDPGLMRTEGTAALAPVLERLSGGKHEDAVEALMLLRTTLLAMGSQPIPKLRIANEEKRAARLQWLAKRLAADHLVPGLTIHQAKGREWDNVGLVLNSAEEVRLASGLTKDSEADRALYVALTRAKWAVASV